MRWVDLGEGVPSAADLTRCIGPPLKESFAGGGHLASPTEANYQRVKIDQLTDVRLWIEAQVLSIISEQVRRTSMQR